MAAKGAWSASQVNAVILAADPNRAEVILQHTAGYPVYLGFGETAVVGEGIRLSETGAYLQITDARARMAIYMICDTGQTASGGYQTADRGDVVTGESGLSLNFDDLMKDIGGFLGYGAVRASWTDAQAAEIERYVQAGVRQYYYPPAVPGVEAGYEWSFLKPTTTVTTLAGYSEVSLPDGFGRLLGDVLHSVDLQAASVLHVGEARILSLMAYSTDEGIPRYVATRFKDSTGAYGQRQEMILWPVPNDVYTLTFRYEAFAGKLSDANPYPLGGMKFAQLIVESCLAVAEQRANDELGLHTEQFKSMLAASVAQDRKNGARCFGQMGNVETDANGVARQTSYSITYKGETW